MTMIELAELAGVSQSTVSLVLNGKADGRISSDLKIKIEHLAEKHNYRVNQAARKLRSREKNLIGIAMTVPYTASYGTRIASLQSKLNKLDYRGVFGFWEDLSQIPDTINRILELGVDALICWDYHKCLEKERVPITLYEQHREDYDCVLVDYEDYSAKLIEYILKMNHLKVGFIGHLDKENPNLRSNHLLQQLPSHGIEIRPEWIKHATGELKSGYESFSELMKNKDRPTLIVTPSDIIAQGIYYKANELGMRIPNDMSIIGGDNMDICDFLVPKLSSFSINEDKLDSALIELVVRRLKKPDSPRETISVGVDFIERESCIQM